MGIIFSRFRKKESTKEILSKIQDEITLLQEAKANTEQSRRKLGLYIIYAWILFIAVSVALYCYYAPSTLRDKLLSAIPPLFFIFMIFCTKYFFNYIYQWKLVTNEKKMKALSVKKSKILEEVMETETYKVAKEILEMYSPDILHKNMSLSVTPMIQKKQIQKSTESPSQLLGDRSLVSTPQIRTPYVIRDSCSEVRRRVLSTAGNGNTYPNMGQRLNFPTHTVGSDNFQGSPNNAKIGSSTNTPFRVKPISQSRLYNNPVGNEVSGSPSIPPGPPMPRPVLPRERGVFERFVEVLVGDGPSNRYALVCRQCESHNGMALKEEFEYLSYRCVYCYYWNPAKKQRPSAPKIADAPTLASQLQLALQKSKSDVEKTSSGEDSEQDSPIMDIASESELKMETEANPDGVDSDKEHKTITENPEVVEENSSVEERSEEPKIE